MKYNLQKIAEVTGGRLLNPADVEVTSVEFDSRQIKPEALFVPIKGERDGHDFISAAADNGAVATFVDHEIIGSPIPQILVKDNQQAFWDLAKDYLNIVNPKRVAVSGSNGKTTTKDLIASVLSEKFSVHRTVDSFNNELGVPKTILTMPENTEVAVLEIGMDRPGQLSDLSNLINPDISVLTMVGEAHIEFFKTRAKIADAKMEIIAGMNEKGTLIYNGDEPLLVERATAFDGHQLTFGENSNNQYRVTDIKPSQTNLLFKVNNQEYEVDLLGDFNAVNASAAIAVGEVFGLTNKEIVNGLHNLKITENRLALKTAKNGATIISDVYNSNPTAAILAVDILSNYATDGNRYIVLGDMLELGEKEDDLHASLIEPLNKSQIDRVFLVGPLFSKISSHLTLPVETFEKNQLEQLSEKLNAILSARDTILLKASHGIHLEQVLNNLI